MKAEDQLQERAWTARAPRVDTSFEVLVRCGASEFEARVTNLSGNGFRLRSTRALEPGLEMLLQVAKRPPVKAVIRWAAGEDAGGLFLEPMGF